MNNVLNKLNNLGTYKSIFKTDNSFDSVSYTENPIQYTNGTEKIGSAIKHNFKQNISRANLVDQITFNPVSIKFGNYVFMSSTDGGMYRINTITGEKELIFVGEDVCSKTGHVFDMMQYIKEKAIPTEYKYTPSFLYDEFSVFKTPEIQGMSVSFTNEQELTKRKILERRKVWRIPVPDESEIGPDLIPGPVIFHTCIEDIEQFLQYINENPYFYTPEEIAMFTSTEYAESNFFNYPIMQETWTNAETDDPNNLVLVIDSCNLLEPIQYAFDIANGWDSVEVKINKLDNGSTKNYWQKTIAEGTGSLHLSTNLSEVDIYPTYQNGTEPYCNAIIDAQGWNYDIKSISNDLKVCAETLNIINSDNYLNLFYGLSITKNPNMYNDYEFKFPVYLTYGENHNIYIGNDKGIKPHSNLGFSLKTDSSEWNSYNTGTISGRYIDVLNNIHITAYQQTSLELTALKFKKNSRIGRILDLKICYDKLIIITEDAVWCSEDGIDFYKVYSCPIGKSFTYSNNELWKFGGNFSEGDYPEVEENFLTKGFVKLFGNDTDGWYLGYDFYGYTQAFPQDFHNFPL